MNDSNNNAYPPRYQDVDLTPNPPMNDDYNLHVIEEFRNAKRFQRTLRSDGKNDSSYDTVFIWSVEEATYLNEECRDISDISGSALFSQLIKNILTKHGFGVSGETIENDVVNIEDVVDDGTEEMKRVKTNYDLLERFYNEISDGIRDNGEMINYELLKKCEMSNEASDLYIQAEMVQTIVSNRWQYAKQSLELVNQRSAETGKKYANVIISDEGIGSALAQLLISGHSKQIEIENVYSTFKASKESVYKRIRRRFGEKCTFVIVTINSDTIKMAKKLNMLAWNTWSTNLIQELYKAQRDTFLQ